MAYFINATVMVPEKLEVISLIQCLFREESYRPCGQYNQLASKAPGPEILIRQLRYSVRLGSLNNDCNSAFA